jgi:site-specific recombinase XerD
MEREVADFLTWGRRRRRWADTTVEGYRLRIESWIAHCRANRIRLTRATRADVAGWLDSLYPGPATHSQARTAAVAFYDYLVSAGRVSANPARRIERLPQRRSVPRALDPDQVRAVLTAASRYGTKRHCYIGLLFYAGLRRSEACRVRWADLEGEDGWLRVLGKGGHERVVPVCPELRGLVLAHRSANPSRLWLFAGQYPGDPVSVSTATRWTRQVLDDAGLPHVTGHQARHSFATSMLQAGWDAATVGQALGHVDLSATTRYTRARSDRVAEAVQSLPW